MIVREGDMRKDAVVCVRVCVCVCVCVCARVCMYVCFCCKYELLCLYGYWRVEVVIYMVVSEGQGKLHTHSVMESSVCMNVIQ